MRWAYYVKEVVSIRFYTSAMKNVAALRVDVINVLGYPVYHTHSAAPPYKGVMAPIIEL